MLTFRSSQNDLASGTPTTSTARNRRLSKPKTTMSALSPVSSSTNLELIPTASPRPSPTGSQIGQGSGSLSSEDSAGRQMSRQKLREQIFLSDQEQAYTEEAIEDGPQEKKAAETTRPGKGLISRTSTLITKRTSVRLSLGPLGKSQSRLTLKTLDDQTPEETDRLISQIKQKAHDDSIIAFNHIASPVEREEDGPISMPTPIRRRSLFTPGLATRVPNDLLRKPPAPGQAPASNSGPRNRYYDRTLSESSPLDRLAALDLADKEGPSPGPRSATPADLDYGHLGAQSALRITNGAASPIPSMHSAVPNRRKSSSEHHYQDSFYTASEGIVSDDEEPVPTLKETHRRSGEFVCRSTTPRQGIYGIISRPQLAGSRSSTQEGSPLRRERRMSNSTTDDDYMSIASSSFGPCASFSEETSLDHTSMIAQQYIADIPSSPFVSTPYFNHSTTSFHPTSKANEMEDELFDDSRPGTAEGDYEQWNTSLQRGTEAIVHSGSSLDETFATVSHSTFMTATQTSSSIVSVAQEAEGPGQPESVKDDSGYSSGGSWKEQPNTPFYTDKCFVEGDSYFPETVKPQCDRNASDITTTSYSTPYVTVLDDPERMPAAVRPSSTSSGEVSRPQGSLRQESSTSRSADRGRDSTRSVTKLASSWERGTTPYTSTTPQSESVTASSSRSKSRSSSRGPRKLQKKPRPKSQPPPANRIMVQGQRELSGSHVPPVPLDVAARHAARFQEFPPLDRTLPTLRGEKSGESVSNNAPVSEPVRFPSPAYPPVSNSPKRRMFSSSKLTFSKLGAEQREEVERRRIPGSSKAEKRLSRQGQPEHSQANIADFGDVSESLGASPYDIAGFAVREPSSSKRTVFVHPHQFTTALPRAKSMVGMDEFQAAECARLRSQYNKRSVSNTKKSRPSSHLPSSSNPFGLPPNRCRFDDRGGIPGKMPRPTSMAFDAPPVPAMPVKEKVEDLERHRAHSQSQHFSDGPIVSDRASMQFPTQLDWNSASTAWAQRRKSAGDGLLARPQAAGANTEWPRARSPQKRLSSSRPSASSQPLSVSKRVSRSYALPPSSSLAQMHPLSPLQTPSVSANRSDVSLSSSLGVREGLVARLSGRFENGLGFGYEPGYGIGGSAGTRGGCTAASRKSVEWSKGYGVDLSDVPIFVAPGN